MEVLDQKTKKKLLFAQSKYDLKQEFEYSIKDRVERYVSVYQWQFTPYTHFAPVSAEGRLLYRDGYFFACIALCQSVAEALSRFLCDKFFKSGPNDHTRRVKRLRKHKKISVESEASFENIHEHRNDFHHLSPETPTEREKLQEIALRALKELSRIENEVFAFSLKDGVLTPKYSELWRPETLKALQKANDAVSRDQG